LEKNSSFSIKLLNLKLSLNTQQFTLYLIIFFRSKKFAMEGLIHFDDPNFWLFIKNAHKEAGGIYKVIAICDQKRVPINRFLGIDPDGVLYIGMGLSYRRIAALKKSISPDYKGKQHICGRRYKSNPNIAKVFPYETLFIEAVYSHNPKELEQTIIETYRSKYGEVPPLNAI